MLILRPRASRMAPRDAAAMPLPSEETTPPVTQIKRVIVVPSLEREGRCVSIGSGGCQENLVNGAASSDIDDGRAGYRNDACDESESFIRHALDKPRGLLKAC